MDIVKRMMIEEETPEYTLRTKTGWGNQNSMDIGWYVGYVEKNENTYFFATCIQSAKADETFPQNRRTITRKVLVTLDILPKETKPEPVKAK